MPFRRVLGRTRAPDGGSVSVEPPCDRGHHGRPLPVPVHRMVDAGHGDSADQPRPAGLVARPGRPVLEELQTVVALGEHGEDRHTAMIEICATTLPPDDARRGRREPTTAPTDRSLLFRRISGRRRTLVSDTMSASTGSPGCQYIWGLMATTPSTSTVRAARRRDPGPRAQPGQDDAPVPQVPERAHGLSHLADAVLVVRPARGVAPVGALAPAGEVQPQRGESGQRQLPGVLHPRPPGPDMVLRARIQPHHRAPGDPGGPGEDPDEPLLAELRPPPLRPPRRASRWSRRPARRRMTAGVPAAHRPDPAADLVDDVAGHRRGTRWADRAPAPSRSSRRGPARPPGREAGRAERRWPACRPGRRPAPSAPGGPPVRPGRSPPGRPGSPPRTPTRPARHPRNARESPVPRAPAARGAAAR